VLYRGGGNLKDGANRKSLGHWQYALQEGWGILDSLPFFGN
jgi:hypothetical protein